jgi:hypothetical protein
VVPQGLPKVALACWWRFLNLREVEELDQLLLCINASNCKSHQAQEHLHCESHEKCIRDNPEYEALFSFSHPFFTFGQRLL